ncbi:MAG: hypothetical protein Q9166_006791 [cf. Caloplaca sp. 2 TL-2023]
MVYSMTDLAWCQTNFVGDQHHDKAKSLWLIYVYVTESLLGVEMIVELHLPYLILHNISEDYAEVHHLKFAPRSEMVMVSSDVEFGQPGRPGENKPQLEAHPLLGPSLRAYATSNPPKHYGVKLWMLTAFWDAEVTGHQNIEDAQIRSTATL